MATLEYYQQQLEKADKKLDELNAALEAFKEGEGEGKLLVTLRLKELREDLILNAREKAALERLAEEEARLIKAVETCREVWVRRDKDLRQARTQPGNDFVTRALGT